MATQTLRKLDKATRDYIDEAVERKFFEFAHDPDEGLELRPEFIRELKRRARSSAKTISFEEIKKKYL